MYKLNTGDKDNTKYMYAFEVNPRLKEIIKRNHTQYNVQLAIFSESFDEKDYDDIVAALTIGDELSVPIEQKDAQILFFALNVNMNNFRSRIRSITKANIFYNDFEGDYSKVTFIDTKSAIVHIAKVFYHGVVPGVSISYKIPFYVVNGNAGYHFTIAELDKYTMLINDIAETITRKSLYKLLNRDLSRSFRNHEEVMNAINMDIEILEECLEDANFTKKSVEFPFDNAMCLEITSDNQILAWESLKEESEYWEQKGSDKYLLNEHYSNIVPMLPSGAKMTIYTI